MEIENYFIGRKKYLKRAFYFHIRNYTTTNFTNYLIILMLNFD